MYVVGFIGADKTLGRTFICHNQQEIDAALAQQRLELNIPTIPIGIYWDDECCWSFDLGVVFVGGLETLDDMPLA